MESGSVAAAADSSAPSAEESGVSSSRPSGLKTADTSAEIPSKQGVLQALASMMAEKDIKVRGLYSLPVWYLTIITIK